MAGGAAVGPQGCPRRRHPSSAMEARPAGPRPRSPP